MSNNKRRTAKQTASKQAETTVEETQVVEEQQGEGNPNTGSVEASTGDTAPEGKEPVVEEAQGDGTTGTESLEASTGDTQPVEKEPVLEEVVKDPYEGKSAKFVSVFTRLDDYLVNMAPNRPTTADEIKVNQGSLYRIFLDILRLQGEEFEVGMYRTLGLIHANIDGAFNDRYVFRGFSDITLAKVQRDAFEGLLRLFTTTADPVGRKTAVKGVDVTAVAEMLRDGDSAQRLISFYKSI